MVLSGYHVMHNVTDTAARPGRVRCGPLFSRPTAAPWGVNILLFLKKKYIERMLVLGGGPTRAPLENASAAYFDCRRAGPGRRAGRTGPQAASASGSFSQ